MTAGTLAGQSEQPLRIALATPDPTVLFAVREALLGGGLGSFRLKWRHADDSPIDCLRDFDILLIDLTESSEAMLAMLERLRTEGRRPFATAAFVLRGTATGLEAEELGLDLLLHCHAGVAELARRIGPAISSLLSKRPFQAAIS